MKTETGEWIEKAEGDFHTARREAAAHDFPNAAAVCFHAQQCAEKYLKALLVEHSVYFPRTHDLLVLLDLAGSMRTTLEAIRDALVHLSPYAVDVRYPGDRADSDSAAAALVDCTRVRTTARMILGIAEDQM